MNNLHDSVERWLVQEGYSIIETKTEDNFKIIVKNIDAFSNNLEIFEPKEQANVLVIGVKIPLKSKQMIRYRILNQKEKENFEKKMTDFCYSIQAISKFFDETKTEDNFKIIIKNIDAFSNNLEIFEPKQQANVLVIDGGT